MVLYTKSILSLSTELAEFPLLDALDHRGSARSRVCGSTVNFGCRLDPDATVIAVGARVSACAIGQASAALFLRNAAGLDQKRIDEAHEQLSRWLVDEGSLPQWPGIVELDSARAYPARHPVILLPWKAALDALSKAGRAG